VRAYNTLFGGTGKLFKDEGNGLDRTSFSKGYALYAFDLTPDLGQDDHFNLAKQGSVRLVLKFHDALTENVTVIAYAELQNVVEIDRIRNFIYDFAVRTLTNCSASLVTTGSASTEYSVLIVYQQSRDCWCVIPIRQPCPVNTGLPSTSTTMVIMENISTLLDEHLLDNLNIT